MGQTLRCLHVTFAVIHHLSTKERRIRAIREMARTLRAGGRVMIYVWAMEQKRRKFEKQDIFVPWNPNPRSPDVGPPSPPPGRATAQSAGDDGDKHRKVRSTSSVADGAPHRLWFFSRSLDSVLDFGSLSVSRSSSRELSSLSGGAAGPWGPGRALIEHFSSFFSPPSTVGSEEDVFGSGADLHKEPEDVKEERGGAGGAALAPECGALALPDLVPFQRERSGRESAATDGSCLRYYHVFREGELAQLIADHVAQLRVRHAYFDHANWCVVAEKVEPGKI
ncbi:probable tRNA methyltransferase 9-like protein [Hippocampus comes]|uniref:probable tRNA methyltransferase 9-like protein n=1 Tax=Hippocampus comes TaxID=109280 RepID=UPI00094E8C25|nr:PREDICTED: probable tRNA methyltransferase 9-like protein [Hippocampus comes]